MDGEDGFALQENVEIEAEDSESRGEWSSRVVSARGDVGC